MVKPESSTIAESTWLRRYSLVLAVMSVGVLTLEFWYWVRGHGHWYDTLPGLALLTLALTNVFERRTKHILQFVSLVFLIAAIAMLIARV